MKSILHLTRNTRFSGGGPSIMLSLIKEISGYQHQVGGILTQREIRVSEGYDDKISLVDNCALPTTKDLIPLLRSYRLSRTMSNFLRPSFPWRMYRKFGPYGFNLVHSHYSSEIDKQAEAILEYFKIPMIWTVHSVPDGNDRVYRQLERFNALCRRYPNSTSVVAVSQSVKRFMESACPDVGVQLIYNATEVNNDPGTSKPAFLRDHGIRHPNPFIVCSVGRLNPEKGIEYLINAAAKVVAENDDVIFIHLGEGYLKPKLLKRVEYHGLKDKFFFLGHKTDIGKYLGQSDLYVLPSISEAFGLSLLEALTVGLPSIVSNVGGIPEVTNPNCSIFVRPADDRGIANAILDLIADRPRMQLMSAAALEQSRKFSMTEMISDYQLLYAGLLENSN